MNERVATVAGAGEGHPPASVPAGQSKYTMADVFGEEGVGLKLRIMHAVDRSLDELTVARICERAGVSRQVFYRNFDSKYSLHWWWPMHVHRFYLAEVGRSLDWLTGYERHIELLSMEKDFFRIATGYTATMPCVNSVMPGFRRLVLMETLRDYRGMEIDQEMRFIIDNWVKTETEVLTDWYRNGSTPAPAEAARLLVELIPPRLHDAMRVE